MTDGIIKGTGNSRYLKGAGWPATYEEFKAMAEAGTLPFDLNGINEAGWQQLATALNKANLLDDTTALKMFSSPSGNETVNRALSLLSSAALAPYATIGDKPQGYSVVVDEFEFVKVTDNYNGVSGNTLMLCKTGLATEQWDVNNGAYSGGTLDTYLTGTYYNSLPEAIKNVAVAADVPVYSGTTSSTAVTTMQRKVFAPSRKEIWGSGNDGTSISGFDSIVASMGLKWTRTPTTSYLSAYVSEGSTSGKQSYIVPFTCIVIPSSFRVSWSITDVFGQLLTIPSSQLDTRVQIAEGTYTGTGSYGSSHPNSIIFPFVPKVVFVQAKGFEYTGVAVPQLIVAINGTTLASISDNTGTWAPVNQYYTWTGNTFSWYAYSADPQLNKSGAVYYYVAIGDAL